MGAYKILSLLTEYMGKADRTLEVLLVGDENYFAFHKDGFSNVYSSMDDLIQREYMGVTDDSINYISVGSESFEEFTEMYHVTSSMGFDGKFLEELEKHDKNQEDE